ncbi:uncharacterized protein BJ212DRAFT_1299685 [Suillus subaureus]|uniref:Uncharacterized protein n=1 Tax=Suillus subaureus TaxID=48587 RepID=A0A9P7EBC6_9AGAM|nr:uncharacterized protein BJ212DRAFT_1299685 [Suillus subaureus]KAG1816405.1 hypothetical protein BJ212DRAFT_1299685 [Suillus subaureus]
MSQDTKVSRKYWLSGKGKGDMSHVSKRDQFDSKGIGLPWGNLNKEVLYMMYLQQVVLQYDVQEEVSLNCNEQVEVVLYVKQLIGRRQTVILAHLPTVMVFWKKNHIQNGRGSIQTHSTTRTSKKQRNSSYVQYKLEYEDHENKALKTKGRDATKEEHYSRNLTCTITDLWNVKGVVGRVKSHGEWTIIDHRSSFTKPAFDGAGYNTDESEVE